MARPQKFRYSREALDDPQVAAKLAGLVLDIEELRAKRKQIDDQIAASYDAVDDAGFEKKFVRKTIALRAKEEGARVDEEQGLEAYEIAVEKGVSLVRTRRLGSYAAATGREITEHEQPEIPANEIHERPSTNDKAYLEAVPQDEASLAGTGSRMLADREGRSEGEAASADLPTNSNPQPTSSPEADKTGEVVPPPASPVAISDADVPAFLCKESKPLRPHCLHPELCASGTRDHCWSCKKAMAASEAA